VPLAPRVFLLVLALGLLTGGPGCRRQPSVEPWIGGPVDVNTASEAELERLPGVTPSMARRIYEGRPYKTLDELVERGLLSERELDRVRRKITVAQPKR
jgi:DNA uptake protein ComE-like DNA-binding protein